MSTDTRSNQPDIDAVVVGAGFSGLRMLVELRKLGLQARCFEAGSDVGGTWYWNRYPGARTDSEAWFYCYDFDEELMQEWDWQERFPTQKQSLAYLRHVADKFDLRKEITFNTRVTSAAWSDDDNLWTLTTETGETVTARHFCAASGLLSVAVEPPFPGVQDFEGEWYMSSRWPHTPVELSGKRVAVVGTGATAVQIIPTIADEVEQLTVFQRTANYVIPARNYVATEEKRQSIKRDYSTVWEETYAHPFGMWFPPANRVFDDVPDRDERQRIFDSGWEAGGFRFLFETFDDMLVNQQCNDEASDFIRNKIRSIVKDPTTAELLCPQDHPIGGKRPPAGHFYYEAFNRANVSLVSVRDNPITEIVPKGIKLADGTVHEVDVIIYAMGFDAITGSLTNIDVTGRGGTSIKEAWDANAPAQHLALCGANFPNMYTIAGPQGAFGNFHAFMNKQIEWIGAVLEYAREHGHERVEVTDEAAEAWVEQCEAAINATLLMQGAKAGSWFLGANIEGKKSRVLFYFGGVNAYVAALAQSIEEGFPGYVFDKALTPA
ncbi:NAD(P)/FAD-dependent oxidoreductase [Rhodococcus sp. NCIMB 12038]|uniref:flavin-containing monooxygenase n=1 Tax=Rhodococcus sp. NCIMB 12038 TaxID=933800 RepID=UPI000B3CD480|nr:NAD(P)/FAD-dependent oxidoreductase [Rhodococcus sp. NCIMB 12038]OUS96782.1 cyclohexanone monooxygenase [Rhodococcus sp. NCIMB 12038]